MRMARLFPLKDWDYWNQLSEKLIIFGSRWENDEGFSDSSDSDSDSEPSEPDDPPIILSSEDPAIINIESESENESFRD